jgi:hypothetical protein
VQSFNPYKIRDPVFPNPDVVKPLAKFAIILMILHGYQSIINKKLHPDGLVWQMIYFYLRNKFCY